MRQPLWLDYYQHHLDYHQPLAVPPYPASPAALAFMPGMNARWCGREKQLHIAQNVADSCWT